MVTGDYSRGASGFWIENGKRTYAVSEVTIAGHLLDIFRNLTPGQRSRIPLRHQRADGAAGGSDRCRPVIRRAARRRLKPSCARPARWRARTARGPFKRWTKGDDNSPVTEVDIAVNDLLQPAARPRSCPAPAGCRRKPRTARTRRCRSRWVVDPIDGTRAYHRRPRRLDGLGGAGRKRPARSVAALYAPVTDEMFLAARAGARPSTARRSPPAAGDRWTAPRSRAPSAISTGSPAWIPTSLAQPQGAFAGAATRARGARRRSMPPLPRPAATTGTLRPPIFWCTKPAARLTDFDGQPLRLQRPARRAWRAGCGRVRAPRRADRTCCATAAREFA